MRLPIRLPPGADVPTPTERSNDVDEARPEEADHDDDAVAEVLAILRLASATGARPRAALALVAENGVGSLSQAFAGTVTQLDRGASLDAALSRPGPGGDDRVRRIHRLLATAELDGSSGERDLDALQRDLRLARLTELEVGAHRLAVAIQFPVVLCILPAFILLALVPLVVAVLGDLQL